MGKVIEMEQRRHEGVNPARVPAPGDSTPASVDARWVITDLTERNAIAHLRGWTHHGPHCPLCTGRGA